MARTSTSMANAVSHLFNMSKNRTFDKIAKEPSPERARHKERWCYAPSFREISDF